jgi:hypothetical protein
VSDLFMGHATGLQDKGVLDMNGLDEIATALRRVERYWTDQIRHIYRRLPMVFPSRIPKANTGCRIIRLVLLPKECSDPTSKRQVRGPI